MPGEGVKVRLLAVLSSATSLLANLVFSLLVTRKLATFSLGVLNVVNGAVIMGLIIQTIVSFMATRVTARDGKPSVYMFALYLISGLLGSIIALLYITGVSWRFRQIYIEVSYLTIASTFASYLQGYATSVLTVIDRVRLQGMGIVTSITKLLLIIYIMYSGWSLFSVLVSSIIITLSAVAYGLTTVLTKLSRVGSLGRYFKETFAASWVPLIGYGAGNLRSMDSMIIGYVGGILDNAMWQVLNVQGKALGLATGIINVTYGELLSGKDLERRFYIDLLILLNVTIMVALFLVFYEPYIVYFLRPQDYSFIQYLRIPVILLTISTIASIINQYYSWIMQGIDRVDFNGEVTFKTYVGSLVFHAHFAEFILTVVYIASIYPLIILSEIIRLPSPVISGVLLASILATLTSLTYRFIHLEARRRLKVPVKSIILDIVTPSLLTALVTYMESTVMLTTYPPVKGAVGELIRITIGAVLTAVTYLAVSLTVSSNIRRLFMNLVTYVVKSGLSIINRTGSSG
ncbi:hypothetical protein [Caldivirga sp.]|uniref:hypothetical protein n=1 Tax=Caldivirga sp. TaxID=2080243 RepID=UPI0025B93E54|nr:hypothetical protein [Caldivirga sp.]